MRNLLSRLGRNEKGFTLIELLVVVAIIALLATFAVPKLFEAINKSKKAPGQSDMQTISSALERYYFDNNAYPSGDAATVMAALRNGYLKSGTTFRNGFKQGYIYVTTATGSGYFLVDMQGVTGATVGITCGTSAAFTVNTATGDTAGLQVHATVPAADINTCAVTTPATGTASVAH